MSAAAPKPARRDKTPKTSAAKNPEENPRGGKRALTWSQTGVRNPLPEVVSQSWAATGRPQHDLHLRFIVYVLDQAKSLLVYGEFLKENAS